MLPTSRSVPVSRARGEASDEVAIEEPLEIRVEGIAAAITMRTPGSDLDLTAGFLLGEGVIDGADDLRALAHISENVVDVRLAEGVPAARARGADRELYATSSCGICGKASLDRIPKARAGAGGLQPDAAVIQAAARQLSQHMPMYQATGGVHGAALFDASGALLLVREDVGRHNAVDKVIGAHLRAEGDFRPLGLIVSSRAGFEVVQKASAAGLGCVACFGAATSLAIDAAIAANLRLYGWASREPVMYHRVLPT